MRNFLLSLSAVAALACGGPGGNGNGDTSGGDTDLFAGANCVTRNEDCGPGVGGCGGEGSDMLPGADCLSCHVQGGGEAPKFTAGGTVFKDANGTGPARGVSVTIIDNTGKKIELTSNDAGNFYTTESMEFPILGSITKNGITRTMATPVSTGACSSCHTCTGAASAKLYAP